VCGGRLLLHTHRHYLTARLRHSSNMVVTGLSERIQGIRRARFMERIGGEYE
jgi:hypothetical protein